MGMILGSKLIGFFMGPAGRIALLAIAFVGWTLYQRHDATADCEAEELRQELIESQRQLAISNQIANAARERADQTEQEMAETERLYDEIKKDLLARPEANCPISPATRDRLLRIK